MKMEELECVYFHSEQGAMTHMAFPVRRSNDAMDENRRTINLHIHISWV